MAAIGTCPCGWTIISPQGVEDVKKYAMMHMREIHPETVVTPEELMSHIKRSVDPNYFGRWGGRVDYPFGVWTGLPETTSDCSLDCIRESIQFGRLGSITSFNMNS